MSEQARFDTATIVPQASDPRRPPQWLGRGLVMAVVAVYAGIFVWRIGGQLSGIFITVLITLFIALSLEPAILWLIRHGWKRPLAAGTAEAGFVLVIAAMIGLFGNLFIQQMSGLINQFPTIYDNARGLLRQRFGLDVPEAGALWDRAVSSWGDSIAGTAWSTGISIVGGLFNTLTILLLLYYLCAAGPKFRASVCQWLPADQQRVTLHVWAITQDKVSGFMNSRIILAAFNTFFTAVFLAVIDAPYWLPLAVFSGLVSQFVPTIGTYIGGALPVLFVLGANGLGQAIAVVVFLTVYQQIENLVLAPRISARTLEMNPAVSFLVVVIFGATFGALGAFLALPISATIQAVFTTYVKRQELIDSPTLVDPSPKRDQGRDGAEAGESDASQPDEGTSDEAESDSGK